MAADLDGPLTRILDAPLDSASRESSARAVDDVQLSIQSRES